MDVGGVLAPAAAASAEPFSPGKKSGSIKTQNLAQGPILAKCRARARVCLFHGTKPRNSDLLH